jgi:hypothetical protein
MSYLRKFRFFAGFTVASLIFGGTAIAVNVNNTPEGGYLLCYNVTTKAVTFPGKLRCPTGTKPLELGAQGSPGVDGSNGRDGIDGRDGVNGKDGNTALTYNAYIKSQDVVVTDTVKGKRVIVLKASDLVGSTAQSASYLFDAHVDVYFPSTTTSSSDKWAYCAWRDAKDWSTSTQLYGKGDSAQIYGTIFTSATLQMRGVMTISSSTDKYLICTLYGTGQITGGFVTAQETRGSYKENLGA